MEGPNAWPRAHGQIRSLEKEKWLAIMLMMLANGKYGRGGASLCARPFRPGSTDSCSKPCAHEPKCPCLRLRSIPVLKEVCSGLPSEEVAADAKTTES